MNNLMEIEALITELELSTESLDVVLTDQENTMFNFDKATKSREAFILNAYDSGATRNYIMIKILGEIKKNLEQLNNTYMKMIRSEREVENDKNKSII